MRTTGNIFISYRREDASAHAGRLCDQLSAIAGPDRVFMDVEDIVPGQNFAETIDRSIAACEVALVVIGPRWAEILRERLQKQEPDYVYNEVSSALAHRLKIVPVLVGGAAMPGRAELPEAMAGLPFHHAAELRDNTFRDDCQRLAKSLRLMSSPKLPWRKWALAAAAVVLALAGTWMLRARTESSRARLDPRLATARTQSQLGEHQSAFGTYEDILKSGSAEASVIDLQADAAMAWVRDFRIAPHEGQRSEDVAGPPLDRIIAVLEAALSRAGTQGARAGDILAHLGWAHWLNRHIAGREFGPAAERNLRQVLAADSQSVFAHAMLGNWLLQTHGSTAEALEHFDAAEKRNQQRPLVRQMQLGGMVSSEEPGIAAALMRTVNRMRIGEEAISDRYRSRLLSYFRPGNGDQVREMLSAVPPDEAWATFQWLDDPSPGDAMKYQGFRRDLVHARVLELKGSTAEAGALLADLQTRMRGAGFNGRLADDVSGALKRLKNVSR